MKYSVDVYARAFFEATRSSSAADHGKLVKRFIKVITKNGDASRLPFVFREIQKRFIRATGGSMIDIALARPVNHEVTDGMLKQFSKKDFVRFSIDPALVAGARVTINGEREYDNSFANRLKKIFKS
ncbi:MAG: F0F1 ATP synthase subunit delta [Patescibacteria group bacterium]|mgnify:CR=1 FL=1